MGIPVDTVQLKIVVETDYDAQHLNKLKEDLSQANDRLKELEESRKAIEKAKPKKGDTAAWAEYEKRLESVNQDIKAQREVVEKATRAVEQQKQKMGINALTLRELQNELKRYNTILNNLQPGTEQFNQTKQHIDEIKGRIAELKGSAISLGGGTKNSLIGMAANFNHIGFAIQHIINIGSQIKDVFVGVYNYFEPMAKAAMELEGIERAFKRINQPGMLDNLRAATHGTVSDLELMKQAVKFKDFNLPVEQLGTYLAFAQQKAKDTGESIDYLVTSIVNGLGRQSPQILDNLGLSAKQISEEAKRSGDFFDAVAKIVEQRMSEAGDYVETFAERAKQGEVELENAQADLGKSWLPVKEAIDSTWTTLQMWLIKSIAKVFEFVDWCKELYDEIGTLRVVVEAVVVVFDTAFKLIEVGFWTIVDVVKVCGNTIRGLANIIEGALTFDWDQVKKGWQDMTANIADNFIHLADKASDAGRRWGDNFIDSINRSISGRVKAPEVPNNTAPEVTILGKKPKADPEKLPKKTPTKEDPYAKDLAELEKANRQKQILTKMALAKQYLTESEAQEQQFISQQAFYAAKIELQKKYGKDSSDTELAMLDSLIAETRRKDGEQKKAERDIQQQHRDELKALDMQWTLEQTALTRQRLSGELATEKEYQEKKLAAELDYLTRKLNLIKAQGGDIAAIEKQMEELRLRQMTDIQNSEKASLDREMKSSVKSGDFDGQLSVLQQQLSAKLITQEQYEDELTRITEEQEQRRHAIRDEFAQQAQALMSATSSLFSALQSREESRVDAKYKKLIAQAKKQGKDTSKLEEQQEAEKLEIKKKYADKQFLMNVLNIMANTALGITKTIAEWGMPWAVPFVAMTAASGAVQLATAKAQRDQAAGLYSGGYSEEYVEGYTGDGDPKDVAGAIPVHKREFVVNHEALKLPMIRRVTNVIDTMQKRRVYSMTDATAELQRAVSPGLASGGYSSTRNEEGGSRSEAGGDGDAVGRLVPLMERNNALLDEMLESGITILELRRQIRRQEQLEKNASR